MTNGNNFFIEIGSDKEHDFFTLLFKQGAE